LFCLEEARCAGKSSQQVDSIDYEQAAKLHMPVAQTVMRQAAIPAFLNPMEFTKIRFLGGKLGDAMAKEYEANTVGDML
jgi:hypothetical protein